MAISLVLHSIVYIFLSSFASMEHLVKSVTLIIETTFLLLSFLNKGTVIVNYV